MNKSQLNSVQNSGQTTQNPDELAKHIPAAAMVDGMVKTIAMGDADFLLKVRDNKVQSIEALNPEVMAFFAKLGPAYFYVVIDNEVNGVPVKHIRISPMFDNDTDARAFLAGCGEAGAYLVKLNFLA
ncbi:MAG: hypothetical protein PHU14_04710 [Methylovulum sp.]|nr:hypothetical protein [Methylovulum sp.]